MSKYPELYILKSNKLDAKLHIDNIIGNACPQTIFVTKI